MKFKLCLVLIWLLGMAGCKTISYRTANVVFLSVSNGMIAVRSIGLGQNKEDAQNDAEKNAIYVLLFRGMPGSGQETPLLTIDEEQFKLDNPAYWKTLFGSSLRYKTFVVSSVPVSDLQKQGHGRKSLAVDVKVNFRSLRFDLEKQGLIRRFGY